MVSRLAAPSLAAAALLTWLAGAGGLASLLLLAAIVAGAVRLLLAVGEAAEDGSDRLPAVASAAGLTCLVAAGALHLPAVALGLFLFAGLDLAGAAAAPVAPARRRTAELVETPVSRAA